MIVVDCSILVDALIGTPDAHSLAAALSGQSLHAPALLDFEVVAVLRKLTLATKLSPARARDALLDFQALPICRWEFSAELQLRAFDLRANFSIYDAAYISLAESLRCPLLTRNVRLGNAPGSDAEVLVK